MSNFINPSVLAAEALDQLDYELVAGSLLFRDRTEDFANVRGMKVGQSVNVRTVTDFQTDEFTTTINTQEINQSSASLTIEKHFDVSVEITSKERALNLDGIRDQIINPAMVSMAQKVDTYLLSKVVGARGLYASANLLQSASSIALARAQANVQQIMKANRIALVSNSLEATLLGTDTFSKFDTRGRMGETALADANLGRLMGIDWYSSVNWPDAGILAGDTYVATLDNGGGANNIQGGLVLTVSGDSGIIAAGSFIKIAGAKRQYRVASVSLVGHTITLQHQIDESLQGLDGAAITCVGGATATDFEGVILSPGAFSYAAPPLDAAAGDKSGVASAAGLSVRMTEAYDIQTKKTFWSFDMLVGAAAIDGRKAMLLGSKA